MDKTFAMTGYRWPWVLGGAGELRGRPLRYLLTTILQEADRALTVRELVGCCEREGVVFDGRGSKIVSDALRWEVGWGRVVRIGRGVYRVARVARSTRYWIGRRVRDIRDYLARLRTRDDTAAVPGVSSGPRVRACGPDPNG
jgi:hypothetical protein